MSDRHTSDPAYVQERVLLRVSGEMTYLASSQPRKGTFDYLGLPWEKFAASSMLPLPLYTATCGYTQRGRVRSTLPAVK